MSRNTANRNWPTFTRRKTFFFSEKKTNEKSIRIYLYDLMHGGVQLCTVCKLQGTDIVDYLKSFSAFREKKKSTKCWWKVNTLKQLQTSFRDKKILIFNFFFIKNNLLRDSNIFAAFRIFYIILYDVYVGNDLRFMECFV